jgi:hypothetical protein
VLGAFPAAALVALCYRFPIPLGGYQSGPQAMLLSVVAVIVYGLLGGFVLLAALGAAGGALAHRLAGASPRTVVRLTIGFAAAIDLVAVLALATLDKFIGPW